MEARISRSRMCYKKKSYQTLGLANAAAEKFNLRVYDCPICSLWHTTSATESPPEFVTKQHMDAEIKRLLKDQRDNIGKTNVSQSKKINELMRENKRLWKENIQLRSFIRDSKYINQPKETT